MNVSIRQDFNLDLCTCRAEHCLCTDAFYDLSVAGSCQLVDGDYVTKVETVVGLPPFVFFSDLRPLEQGAIVDALIAAYDEKVAVHAQLRKMAKAIRTNLAVEEFTQDTQEKALALSAMVKRIAKNLETLADEAQEAA